MKFDFCQVLLIYILCTIYLFIYFFWNIDLNVFLKDEGMHNCDLFSQEELDIGNVLPLFKRVSLICNHDS